MQNGSLRTSGLWLMGKRGLKLKADQENKSYELTVTCLLRKAVGPKCWSQSKIKDNPQKLLGSLAVGLK